MGEPNKRALLDRIQAIAPGGGSAEEESDTEDTFLKNFLPVPDHRRVLEPDTLLVLGGRGTGKTELFRLLAHPSGRETLIEDMGSRGVPRASETVWLAAFGRTKQRERGFPTPESVQQTLKAADGLAWRALWIGLMCGVTLRPDGELADILPAGLLPEPLASMLRDRLPALSEWHPLALANLERLNYFLDVLDNKLLTAGRWLFVTYDELDRLLPSYLELAAPVRELLAFWLDRWRRWDRIRPKIFLRLDLVGEDFLGFPDASKLRAHEVRLEWQTPWLYQLLVKRLANSGEEMMTYLQGTRGLLDQQHGRLGWMPSLNESLFEDLIERMVGKFMGAGPTKGVTYRWVPNHLQDAGGRIAPRSFLKLFALASKARLGRATGEVLPDLLLLHPSDLQGALMETSMDRIRELALEEYPWLEALKRSLTGLEVPATAEAFLSALDTTQWSPLPGKQPPAGKPEEVLKHLLMLGVVQMRPDGRVNMPEIYLYGFGLKRRGGVKRPK